MTPAQIRNEIESLVLFLLEQKLAMDINKPLELKSAGNSSLVTWSNDTELSELFDALTIDEYRITLDRRWFSAVLFDGALLQFSYTFKNGNLKKHRLYFFPCPITFTDTELNQMTISELLECFDGNEFRERIRIEGPIRFDYDLDAGTVAHPPSHLTISRATSRVPVAYPLSIGHFVRFIFSNFYPDQWDSLKAIRDWPCNDFGRCLPNIEPQRLFVDWKLKPANS